MNNNVVKGAIAVLIWIAVWESVVHAIILQDLYMQTAHFWRPEEERMIWLMVVVWIFSAYLTSLIFSIGYQGKGMGEGVRFGLYLGLLMSIPMAYGTYSVMPIPYSLALQWFFYGIVEFVVAGLILAGIFGKSAPKSE